MHFLLTALGSYGDVHPMVGIGCALRERGHEVDVVTSPYFEEEVAGAGLGFVPIGRSEEYLEMTRHPDLWHPYKSLRLVLREGMLRYLQPLYDAIAARCRPGETVIAAHGLDLASRVVHDRLGVPVAAVVHAPMALWSSIEPCKYPLGFLSPRWPRWVNRMQFEAGLWLRVQPIVAPELNRLRRRVGLGPVGRLFPGWWFGVESTLCLFPDWFAPPPPDWPESTFCAGFPLWDGGPTRTLSDACLAFLDEGDAPIVFTPGSANRDGGPFFADAVQACRISGRRGVLLTKYGEQLPAELPPTVRRFEFEPLTQLLPHAAAFVHHGGIGSSSQGLEAGTPQLIRPLAFDQPDNAARLMRLGVAESLPPKQFNAKSAADALTRLMGSDAVKENCRRAAKRCDGHAARIRACEELEGLLEFTL